MKRRDLEIHLRKHGCQFARQGGNHEVWENPRTGGYSAVPRRREVKPGLVRKICKDLQVPAPPNPH